MQFAKCTEIYQGFLNSVVSKGGTVRYIQEAGLTGAPTNVTQEIADAHFGICLLKQVLEFHSSVRKQIGGIIKKILKDSTDHSFHKDELRKETEVVDRLWRREITELCDKIQNDKNSAVETMEQLFEKKEKMGDGLYLKMTEMVKIKYDFCENVAQYVKCVRNCIGPSPFTIMARDMVDGEAAKIMEQIQVWLEKFGDDRITEAMDYALKSGKVKVKTRVQDDEAFMVYYYVLQTEGERKSVRHAYWDMWLQELGVPQDYMSMIGSYVPILEISNGDNKLMARSLMSIAAAFHWDLPSIRSDDDDDEEDSDEEEQIEVTHFEHDGVMYYKDSANIVYDVDANRIGWWNERDQTIDPIRD